MVLLAFIVAVSLWTPLQEPVIAQRWFASGLFYRLLPVPFLVALCVFFMRRAVRDRHHKTPFVLALALVLIGYLGLLVSLWPYAIPSSMTLWEAAAPRSSQMFTLAGAAVIIPIILTYTTLGYWVFRGKVSHDDQHHYH
jgi:cytochrome d ubiquinol oxidase subunit II